MQKSTENVTKSPKFCTQTGNGGRGIKQQSTENVAKSPKFCTQTGNRGRGIEWQCLNLPWKLINNHFCACAVQMLLKMAVNATICSTFEVQYGKSTSTRTTAIRHLVAPSMDHLISRMRRNSCVNTGP